MADVLPGNPGSWWFLSNSASFLTEKGGRAGSGQDVQPEIGILLWTGGMHDVSSNLLLHRASMASAPRSN